jgi:hypothetical protein
VPAPGPDRHFGGQVNHSARRDVPRAPPAGGDTSQAFVKVSQDMIKAVQQEIEDMVTVNTSDMSVRTEAKDPMKELEAPAPS